MAMFLCCVFTHKHTSQENLSLFCLSSTLSTSDSFCFDLFSISRLFYVHYLTHNRRWALGTSLPGFQCDCFCIHWILGWGRREGKVTVWARGVIINPFQLGPPTAHARRWAVLSFNLIHGHNRLVLSLPSLTLFAFQFCLIYLFHNTLQVLVVPQAVEQQGSCFAAFGERPRREVGAEVIQEEQTTNKQHANMKGL